jgi:hypothetical protein
MNIEENKRVRISEYSNDVADDDDDNDDEIDNSWSGMKP